MVLLLHLSRQMCDGNVKGRESSLLVNEDNIEPMVLDVCPHCPTILKHVLRNAWRLKDMTKFSSANPC